jgi:hypothetical protein
LPFAALGHGLVGTDKNMALDLSDAQALDASAQALAASFIVMFKHFIHSSTVIG